MKLLFGAFVGKVKLIENETDEIVDKIFSTPVLDMKVLDEMSKVLVKELSPALNKALKEGGDFGKYIKTKM